jgi:hypothetical protein
MQEMFEKALQRKLRFQFRGIIGIEDLYDLSLKQLDDLYRTLTAASNSRGEGLLERSIANTDDQIRIDLVKHIFESKQASADEAQAAATKAANKQKILALIAEKQDGALREKSIEELKALLEE